MKKIFDDKTIEQLNSFETDLPPGDWEALLAKMPKKRKPIPIWWYGIAASVAILLGTGALFVFAPRSTGNSTSQHIAQVSDSYDVLQHDSSAIQYGEADNKPLPEEATEARQDISTGSLYVSDKRMAAPKNKPRKYGKKKNIAAAAGTADPMPAGGNTEQTLDQGDGNEQKTSEDKRQKPDSKKSLDEYIEELNKAKRKDDSKRQRKELKERNSFARNYYASANTSVSALSGNIGDTRHNMGGQLLASNNRMFIASPYYRDERHYLPVSFGVSIGIPVAGDRLYLNTGLQYTYLYSTIKNIAKASGALNSIEEQHLHYIGVPVALAYNIVDKKPFKVYIAGGATVLHGLRNNHVHRYYKNDGVLDTKETGSEDIKGLLFALNTKAGAAITVLRGLDFYVEPEFSWYIPNARHPQPVSKITKEPFIVNISGGLRWNF